MSTTDAMPYPLTTLHFDVSWQGLGTNFSEVSGLTMEQEVTEYRGGAELTRYVRKGPALRKYGNVTAKRGIVPQEAGNSLFEWFNTPPHADSFRRDVIVRLLNEQGDAAMVWTIAGAWPVKIEGPGLKSTGTDIALESVEFACERITVGLA